MWEVKIQYWTKRYRHIAVNDEGIRYFCAALLRHCLMSVLSVLYGHHEENRAPRQNDLL